MMVMCMALVLPLLQSTSICLVLATEEQMVHPLLLPEAVDQVPLLQFLSNPHPQSHQNPSEGGRDVTCTEFHSVQCKEEQGRVRFPVGLQCCSAETFQTGRFPPAQSEVCLTAKLRLEIMDMSV